MKNYDELLEEFQQGKISFNELMFTAFVDGMFEASTEDFQRVISQHIDYSERLFQARRLIVDTFESLNPQLDDRILVDRLFNVISKVLEVITAEADNESHSV